VGAAAAPVIAFAHVFALAYVAATLLTSGVGHLVAPRRFARVLHAHGLLPPRAASGVAAVVPVLELAAGALALTAILRRDDPQVSVLALLAHGAGAMAGVAFLLYVRRLLRATDGVASPRVASCGCTPLDAPLTSMSAAPAAGLLTACAVGLVATLVGSGAPGGDLSLPAAARALPLAWGVTLAALALGLPAVMPNPALEVHE
jgi:hypothetical protein